MICLGSRTSTLNARVIIVTLMRIRMRTEEFCLMTMALCRRHKFTSKKQCISIMMVMYCRINVPFALLVVVALMAGKSKLKQAIRNAGEVSGKIVKLNKWNYDERRFWKRTLNTHSHYRNLTRNGWKFFFLAKSTTMLKLKTNSHGSHFGLHYATVSSGSRSCNIMLVALRSLASIAPSLHMLPTK